MTRIERGIELTPEDPPESVIKLAERAEAEGFDAVFTSCHYFNRDPFVVLSRVASATDDVLVGPGVLNPYETHPVGLASRAATLQETSGGRAVFGVGAGDASTLSALGIERERPLRRVLETTRVARRLWAGERVEHDGTFQVADAGLNYEVEEIPVYVGAQGPDMLGMAAKHADGVLYNAAHPRDVAWAADRIEEGLAERSREGEFEFLVQASVSVADERERAREAARQAVAFIAGGAAPPVLDRHDVDRERAGRVGELVSAGEYREAFEVVSEAMIDAFAAAGTVEDLEARFESMLEHVDGIVAATPLGPDRVRAIELLVEALDRATPG